MSAEPPRIGAAISWAFDVFRRHPAAFLGLAAVVAVLQTLLNLAAQPLLNALAECSSATTPGQELACESALRAAAGTSVVLGIASFLVGVLAEVGIIRAALAASRGQTPVFAMLWQTEHLGRYIGTLLLNTLIIAVGLVLCIVPGIIAAFGLQLSTIYALDRGLRPLAAVRASITVVRANVGPALLMVVFAFLVSALSGALWGLVTLLTLPFVTLFLVHMYRQFNADPIAAP